MRRRIAPKLALVALVAIVAAIASSWRTFAVFWFEARLQLSRDWKGSWSDADARAVDYVLKHGNEAARERLVALAMRGFPSSRSSKIRGAIMDLDLAEARAFVPRLLRGAAEARAPEQRDFALRAIASIVRRREKRSIYVHHRGELVYVVNGAGLTSLRAKPRPVAAHAWAEWLAAHGWIDARDDTRLELRALEDVEPENPLPLGLMLEHELGVASVTSGGLAASGGIAAGDTIVSVTVGDVSHAATKLESWTSALADARRDGVATIDVEWWRHGLRTKTEATIALPPGRDAPDLGLALRPIARVRFALPDMGAARAGVRESDLIRAVDGVAIDAPDALERATSGKREVELELERDGAVVRVRAKVE